MSKYRIVCFKDNLREDEILYIGSLSYARELKERYGLNHLNLKDIAKKWIKYSRRFDASWVCDCKINVEDVFGVILEEI